MKSSSIINTALSVSENSPSLAILITTHAIHAAHSAFLILHSFGSAKLPKKDCMQYPSNRRKIAGSYCSKEKGQIGKEIVFYLLPSVAGLLVSGLVHTLKILPDFLIFPTVPFPYQVLQDCHVVLHIMLDRSYPVCG